MQQRRDEILAKKAKLAELKRQRELRANQATAIRQNAGGPSDLATLLPAQTDRRDLESLINSLVGDSRPGSTTGGAESPGPRGSRPNSVLSAGELSVDQSDPRDAATGQTSSARQIQSQLLATSTLSTIYEQPPSPVKEVFSYSKGVQTLEDWLLPPQNGRPRPLTEFDEPDDVQATPNKRLSRRLRDREEEIREQLHKEIEEELRAAKELVADGIFKPTDVANFPARALSDEELEAVTNSDDFMDFIDRSTKVIEKALEQDYDILRDYTLQAHNIDDEDDANGNIRGRGRRKVKETAQFYDERWSKKRMISSIDFSPRFSELFLASYTKNPTAPHDPDGIVQVWNMNMHGRPEFIFNAQSDVLTAKFSPFHPNLIIGGTYSGQVLLWDTRSRAAPVLKTPMTGSGHTHPVYSIDLVGTQNANNIISCSTDGHVCVWSVDMLAQPQETMMLTAPSPVKSEDLSPTCMAFPSGDPTFFLVGSEEGIIFPCHRYDGAGAKAGVDARVSYRGHTAPVMSVDFHPAHGPVNLGDLVLSSSLDWSVKLWRVRALTATAAAAVSSMSTGSANAALSTAASSGDKGKQSSLTGEGFVTPILDFVREDLVYSATWSPLKPGVFALVDGAGWLELWDLTVETEEPVARISPSARKDGRTMLSKSLNKVSWEKSEGKRLVTGGIDGRVTLFEVGPDLGGKEGLSKNEEWAIVKKLASRPEGAD